MTSSLRTGGAERTGDAVERAPEDRGRRRARLYAALPLQVVGEVLLERATDRRVLGDRRVAQDALDLVGQQAVVRVARRAAG